MDLNIEVDVKIGAVLLFCDESITDVDIGRNYNIIKMKQNDIPYIKNITDARDRLNTDYFPSRIVENDGYEDIVSFICLQKEDKFIVPAPQFRTGIRYTDRDLDRSEYLKIYKDNEFEHLNTIISLLQIFKKGNIGLKEVYGYALYTGYSPFPLISL